MIWPFNAKVNRYSGNAQKEWIFRVRFLRFLESQANLCYDGNKSQMSAGELYADSG